MPHARGGARDDTPSRRPETPHAAAHTPRRARSERRPRDLPAYDLPGASRDATRARASRQYGKGSGRERLAVFLQTVCAYGYMCMR